MTQPFQTHRPELDEMFEKYRLAPQSTVFAPLADACRKGGMLEEAIEICEKGIAAHPRYPSGYVVYGKCLYDAEQPESAEAAFRKVLEVDANNLVALKFIGIILSERGDMGAARACFEHILALDPDDRDIRRRLDEVGDIAHVAADEPAAAVDPRGQWDGSEDADDVDGEFEGAPIRLGDAAATSDEIATITLADIYASQGYTGKALRIYREVLRRQPGDTDLTRKVAALESREASDAKAAAAATVAESESGAAPVPAEATADEAESAARPVSAKPASGPRIDETRSYEQFKRWLKSVSD
ncbi:MAG TPA: tetratricopeptide repeat protein [Candidatus Krumholzibacteria bacterium]|nr:tetratricopeptide repeat protein [Candidatus Krumholzibacteria bacterium]